MYLQPKSASILLDEKEALSIMNALRKSLPFIGDEKPQDEYNGAYELLALLTNVFQYNKKGVHFLEENK